MQKKIVNWVKDHKKELFIIFLIFLLAFGIRAHLMKYELFFAFDSYYHARMTSHLLELGRIPDIDPKAYYQNLEFASQIPQSQFLWYLSAFIYELGTLFSGYNKEIWIEYVKFLPALFGALISISMYFFGKELHGKKLGILMAFFTAVMPAFVYRTMAGQFEEDSLGFLWMVIGFTFFIKTIKKPEINKKNILYGIISGIFFSIMVLTWEMYLLIPLVLLLFYGIAPLIFFNKFSKKQKIAFYATSSLPVFIFFLSTMMFRTLGIFNDILNKISDPFPYEFGPIIKMLVPILFVLLYLLIFVLGNKIEKLRKNFDKIGLIFLIIGFLFLIVFFLIVPEFGRTGILGSSVGEENTGKQFFGEKYNALMIFPVLALIILPIIIYKRKDYAHILLFFWIFITFFMAWYKLKFTFTFGLAAAAATGYVLFETIKFIQKMGKFPKKILCLLIAFFMLIGVGAGSYFVYNNVPTIEQNNGWKESLFWMKENLPKNSKTFAWWDEGHWITFIGEQKVIIDNRNLDGQAAKDFALFILQKDEKKAFDIVKKYDAKYVIIKEDLLMSLNAIINYTAFNEKDFNADYSKYIGVRFYCDSRIINGQTNEKEYGCGPNIVNGTLMEGLPTQWQEQPNSIQQFGPANLYKSKDYSKFYVLNTETNKTMLVRLITNDTSLKHFKKIYENKNVHIFQVLD